MDCCCLRACLQLPRASPDPAVSDPAAGSQKSVPPVYGTSWRQALQCGTMADINQVLYIFAPSHCPDSCCLVLHSQSLDAVHAARISHVLREASSYSRYGKRHLHIICNGVVKLLVLLRSQASAAWTAHEVLEVSAFALRKS